MAKTTTAKTTKAVATSATFPRCDGTIITRQLVDGMHRGNGGDLTFSRAATLSIDDFEAVTQTAEAEELGVSGGRRVKNYLLASNDFTDGAWSQIDSVTSKTYTDSNGVSGDEVTETGSGNYFLQGVTATVGIGSIWCFSFECAFETPGAAIIFAIQRNDAGTFEEFAAGITPTADFVRYSIQTTAGTFANTHTSIRVIATRGGGDPQTLAIRNCQLEELTTATLQNPSEYIETGTLASPYHGANVDGIRWFNHANGNTVASNVVTETRGADFSAASVTGVKLDSNSVLYGSTDGIRSNDFTLKLTWTPTTAPQGTIFLWGSYVDLNNYTAILHDTTNIIFRKRIGGVNADATRALAFVAGTSYEIAIRADSVGGMDIFVDGTAGTGDADTSDCQLGSTYEIGADGNGANQAAGDIKDFIVYDETLADVNI